MREIKGDLLELEAEKKFSAVARLERQCWANHNVKATTRGDDLDRTEHEFNV